MNGFVGKYLAQGVEELTKAGYDVVPVRLDHAEGGDADIIAHVKIDGRIARVMYCSVLTTPKDKDSND